MQHKLLLAAKKTRGTTLGSHRLMGNQKILRISDGSLLVEASKRLSCGMRYTKDAIDRARPAGRALPADLPRKGLCIQRPPGVCVAAAPLRKLGEDIAETLE